MVAAARCPGQPPSYLPVPLLVQQLSPSQTLPPSLSFPAPAGDAGLCTVVLRWQQQQQQLGPS